MWTFGDLIVRREVLNDGRPWVAVPVYVVEDTDEHLVTFMPEAAPFGFLAGEFPTKTGKHPWSGRASWAGHGTLMVQRPGDDHAVWHFWTGPERRFAYWYVNLQEAFRRTSIGYDTQDLELDIVVEPGGGWSFKDDELLDGHVERGRYTAEQVGHIRASGRSLGDLLDGGRHWWTDWSSWAPEPAWSAPMLQDGWQDVPTSQMDAP